MSEDKLVNAIIALHQEIKGLRSDMDKHQAKTNMGLHEMRTSYMKLNDSFNHYAELNEARLNDHESRISHLENPSVVGEPPAVYKTKKKKK
jgi:hypothetical protein